MKKKIGDLITYSVIWSPIKAAVP